MTRPEWIESRRLALEEQRLDFDRIRYQRSLSLERSNIAERICRSVAVALIAAAVPLAVFIHGFQQQEVENRRAEQELSASIAAKVINPTYEASEQEQLLEFVLITFPRGHPLNEWAGRQLPRIRKIVEDTVDRAEAEARLAMLQQRIEMEAQQPRPGHGPLFAELSTEIEMLEDKINRLNSEISRGIRETGLPGAGGVCCMECDGVTFCGVSVVTACGSCQAGAAGDGKASP